MTADATAIRDKAAALLSGLPDIVKVRFSPAWDLQPDKVPALAIYKGPERWRPDGDPRTLEPRFFHEFDLRISVARVAETDEQLDTWLDDTLDLIEILLLTDPNFVSMPLPTAGQITAFLGVERSYRYPRQGGALYAEGLLSITIEYQTDWPPDIRDRLLRIHYERVMPDGEPRVIGDIYPEQ